MKKNLSTKWFLFAENDFSIGNNMPEKNLKKLMTGVEATDSLGDFTQDAVVIFLITLYISDLLYVFF